MAKWIKLTDYCYHKRLEFLRKPNLNFQEIHSLAMRKLGSRRKGFEPCAVKFSIYQALSSFEDYEVEATCTVILPKRSGIKVFVSLSKSSPFKKVPGADYYTRVLAVKKGTILKMKTLRSDASFNNAIFLYDTPFIRSSELKDTDV